MESLTMFVNLLSSNQLLDKNFISLLIDEYIQLYNLKLDSLEYTNNSNMIAGYGNNKIYINYNNVIRGSVTYLNLGKNLTSTDLTQLNLEIIKIIFHELTHVMQHDKNNANYDLFEKVFNYILKNYDIYKKHHDIMLTEFNANINAAFLTDEFTDKAFESVIGIKNKCLYEEIIQMYLRGYKISSPLNEYNKLTHENIEMLNNANTYEKLLCGMPLTLREKETIENLYMIKKEHNIKTYLKKL